MDYRDLYKPNKYFDNAKVEVYSKLRGFLKKKIDSLRVKIGFTNRSKKFFFRFHRRGELLCAYEDQPSKNGSLLYCIALCRLADLQTTVNDKTDHFILRLDDSNEQIHLKCEDNEIRKKWIATINFFRNHYKCLKKKYTKGLIVDVEPEMRVALAAENEIDNWVETSKKFNHSEFIKDKGLVELFDRNPFEKIKNRLIISIISKETRHKKEDKILEPGTPMTPNTPSRNILSNLISSQYIIVLVSQKPIYIVDEEFAQLDSELIEKESIPGWMEFNTVYFFRHSGPGDITEAKKNFKAM